MIPIHDRCRAMQSVLLMFLLSPGFAWGVSNLVSYQGKLTDADGNAVEGNVPMVFRIFNHVTAGSQLWIETHPEVNVAGGLFHVDLGSVQPLPEDLFSTDGLFLSLQVGTDEPMTPRIPLRSVPYARNAFISEYANVAMLSTSPWFKSGSLLYCTGVNVGIGITAPEEQLHVFRGSGNVKAKIQSANGDADLILDNTTGNPTVEFRHNGAYGAGVGLDPVNDYVFLYHNGSLVFKNNKLGIGTSDPSVSLDVRGDVKVSGQSQGTFPRPNYDSGWQAYTPGQVRTFTHSLGGTLDNYVVDLMARAGTARTVRGMGGMEYIRDTGSAYVREFKGFCYQELSTSSIQVVRYGDDNYIDQIRVRIWVYN